MKEEEKVTLEADFRNKPDFTGTETGVCVTGVREVICSARAREASIWWKRPFPTAKLANSEAMDPQASSFDGISPESSFRQHMHAISYSVRPA
mmetsp:Transcript_19666/g.35697  ORF Transcript_19666/g.35697 Transcript_19666/m.35697 type:complete len:93 (-) Transcript_19666:1751-2029(-)